MSNEWNYHPELPLQDPSVFRWPPRAGFLARWVGRNWLTLSERVMMVLLAVLLWATVFPSLEAAQSLSLGLVVQVWAIVLGLVVAIAGIRRKATGSGVFPIRCMTICSGR
jgi:hypothetical protein